MSELIVPPSQITGEAMDVPSASTAWDIPSAVSFVCGLILIVPFLAGAAAIAMGIIGLRRIKLLNTRGRRMAIAGLILGVLNIAGWSVFLKFISTISRPGREAAHHFFADLASANPTLAQRDCVGSVSPDSLLAASNQIKSWGGLKSVSVLNVTSDNDNGITTGAVGGVIYSPTGEHNFELHTVQQEEAGWKVREFSLQ
jgi:Domain of unknown function (DUF4190)